MPAIVGRGVLDVLRGDRVEHEQTVEDLLGEHLAERHQVFLDADLRNARERGVPVRIVLEAATARAVRKRIADGDGPVRCSQRALLDAVVQREVARFQALFKQDRGCQRLG